MYKLSRKEIALGEDSYKSACSKSNIVQVAISDIPNQTTVKDVIITVRNNNKIEPMILRQLDVNAVKLCLHGTDGFIDMCDHIRKEIDSSVLPDLAKMAMHTDINKFINYASTSEFIMLKTSDEYNMIPIIDMTSHDNYNIPGFSEHIFM